MLAADPWYGDLTSCTAKEHCAAKEQGFVIVAHCGMDSPINIHVVVWTVLSIYVVWTVLSIYMYV